MYKSTKTDELSQVEARLYSYVRRSILNAKEMGREPNWKLPASAFVKMLNIGKTKRRQRISKETVLKTMRSLYEKGKLERHELPNKNRPNPAYSYTLPDIH